MKLPSGKEVTNEKLAEIIDQLVREAMYEEGFADVANSLPADLAISDDDLDIEDAEALVQEIRKTAHNFWLQLSTRFNELHKELVNSKYPHNE